MEEVASGIRLNLGCGFTQYPGYINVDNTPVCKPDMVVDLEKTPWPWKESSVQEIKMEHVLEHLGQTTETYLSIWKELWRVCAPGAFIDIIVPHWNHENFHHDPTHVRPITPIGVAMFDQARNLRDLQAGGRETKLGLMLDIDFSLEEKDVEFFYTGKIADQVKSGVLSTQDVAHVREHQNNISNEIRMRVYAIKPARGTAWLKEHGHAV